MSFGVRLGRRLGRRLGGDFSPLSIPDLALWLDAADTSTIIESGGAVSQWNDKSGNGYHAEQNNVAGQPLTGSDSVSGRNVLSFSANDSLVLPSGLYSLPNGNNTIFAVARRNSGTNFETVIAGTESGGSRFNLRFRNAAGVAEFISNTGAAGAQNSSFTPYSNVILTGRRSSSTSLELWANGGTAATSANAAPENGVDFMTIGSQVSVNYLTGLIGEIVIFNRALSDAEINKNGNYLRNKWGINWSNI